MNAAAIAESGQCWQLDFTTRAIVAVPLPLAGPLPEGAFVWLDVAPAALAHAGIGILSSALPARFGLEPMRELEFGEGWLAFGLVEPVGTEGELAAVNVLFGEGVLVTVGFGRPETLTKLRAGWRDDFRNFAQSPGFFLFEISDHYLTTLQARVHAVEREMDALREQLFGTDVATDVFGEGATSIRRLQEMRRHAVVAAETFDELATRNSAFVAPSTQPYIARNAMRMERLAAELLQQRDALMAALNLYIGMNGHHTGLLLKRLTTFSVIFLPLSFIAGVFGMNFERMPGVHWEHGFAMFCGLAVAITVALLVLARRSRWF